MCTYKNVKVPGSRELPKRYRGRKHFIPVLTKDTSICELQQGEILTEKGTLCRNVQDSN